MNSDNHIEIQKRTLIYIPIIHDQADMGNLRESVRQAALRKLGEKTWRRKVKLVDQIWTESEMIIDNLRLSFDKVRLYQDGLPVCGREIDIVTDLAKAGSRNHRLLLRLMEKGATVMGTESAELLVEEYQLFRSILNARDLKKTPKIDECRKALSESLLERRDRYVADRINTTLREGETGILFLGLLHNLEKRFDKDIKLIFPMKWPVDKGGRRDEEKWQPNFDCR
jgi:hypothetical protein